MSEEKMMRLGQIARKLNVGTATIVESMAKKGFEVENNPNSKISMEQVGMLEKEFKSSALDKEEASHLSIGKRHEPISLEPETPKQEKAPEPAPAPVHKEEPKVAVTIPAPSPSPAPEPAPIPAPAPASEPEPEKVSPEVPKLEGIKILGKIDLDKKPAPKPAQAPQNAPGQRNERSQDQRKQHPNQQQPRPGQQPNRGGQGGQGGPQQNKPQHQGPKPAQSAPKAPAPSQAPQAPKPPVVQKPVETPAPEQLISAKADSLKGLTVLGKIELPVDRPKKKGGPVASSDERNRDKKRPRKRIDKPGTPGNQGGQAGGANRPPQEPRGAPKLAVHRPGTQQRGGAPQQRVQKAEPTPKEIQDQIKQTLARLQGTKPGSGKSKTRRDKRADRDREVEVEGEEAKILKVTEFISANDLAALLDVSVNQIISTCMSLGMFVSINQRLDAEAITIIADEFGYDVEFTKSIEDEMVEDAPDEVEDLIERAPIVTIMGHVDHGKTSLLDYIRMAKVTTEEAGGITQHIGAYDVMTQTGHKIAFLDTPGHEAFTAMRARGAKITDLAIIVIAADDSIMPQTKEAINHAQMGGVPMIFAINKVDKPNANPAKIKEALAGMNLLVEEWGGKYQSQDISAKTGQGIDELLEKVLLEAEILELKANPNKNAVGTVVEASLDKGRGYVATIMVQAGTLRIGDIMLAGQHYGRVKAMFDHKGKKLKEAGPSTPVQVLGLSGAPQAGDTIKVYDTEREAREIANSREQIQREQSLRTKKHITLDEIGRRLAIGSFKELNIIIKGDVDGSVEALSDSLLKLSKDEVKVSIIHKGVGQISESDVLLASASDAIILGFQVRPSSNAKKLAEQEEIEIRHYSIIYDAINQIKDAIEGMLEPTFEEVITGNIIVREIFKITKIGTVAGSYVTDGFITRKNKIRVIRGGIVIHEGEIDQLKRFKDDVSEVKAGYECGISIKNFNNIEIDDTIEGYEMKEIKRKK
ncbi:translation initiation factor IF-2 [Algoriphagus sp.]|jgi:translation initiation factor IF-2|uniref:translation initiation factor IF-2 n=1 Tax=Algoriphagus sp. TaxID=1872435 RepID=UPI00271DDDEC|nr:translation initiation factor IF-2 [Algoriphagus sp.]MDO8966636.1 translation initiation factor IF-2 [Algoriphagus sp.]MDP3202140.1 translation initiation factor IF-2 [Algoriphagus sp.]